MLLLHHGINCFVNNLFIAAGRLTLVFRYLINIRDIRSVIIIILYRKQVRTESFVHVLTRRGISFFFFFTSLLCMLTMIVRFLNEINCYKVVSRFVINYSNDF